MRGLREIKPELIDVGDLIRVELPESNGITMFKQGRVAGIYVHGNMRSLTTEENATLFTYTPGERKTVKIILIDRPIRSAVPLFEMVN